MVPLEELVRRTPLEWQKVKLQLKETLIAFV